MRVTRIGFLWCALVLSGWLAGGILRAEERLVVPQVFAQAACVIDAQTGRILYEKNANERRAVASTQKLLTALLVSERGSLEENVEVERTDGRVEPTKVGIKSGVEYERGQLLRALLVKSGNDVARCLARDHSGGQDAFRGAMNARARRLGMANSHFINAHGLTEEGQFSTARDMAKLAFVAYRDGAIREATATRAFSFSHNGWKQELRNTNRLLQRLPFVNGMKTGFTNAAGRCLICSAAYEEREAIAVVLGSDSKHIWDDAEALIRWGLKLGEEDEDEVQPDEAAASS